MKFKLPFSVYMLVGYCALYTGVWGAVMLFDPEGYYAFANMTPEHFPPSSAFWGWFGISGGLFYGLFLVVYHRAPYMALASAIVSFAGVSITLYMLFFGPLSAEMALIHLSGDVAGTIGFGMAAWLEYEMRRMNRLGSLYSIGGEISSSDVLDMKSQKGQSLGELSQETEVMLVFLRHFGCTFCREAMGDLKRDRHKLEAAGKEIVLVHMVDESTAAKHIAKYGLEDLHRISDPGKRLYGAFDLQRASLAQAFGLRNWVEGFRAGILMGYFLGKETGDGWQMPGVFLLKDGKIKREFRHESAADRPNYCRLGECEA